MPRPNCTMIMEDFFNKHYLPDARQRKRSWDVDCRTYRKYIAPVFGQQKLVEIRSRKIEKWLIGLAQKGLQANSCNRILAILKAILSCAAQGKWITSSPCATVSPLKDMPRQERFLTREEAIRLKARLEQENTPAARVLLLLLLTGARKSEILKARWENVDLEKQILTVPLSKSGKARYISLSSQACEILCKMRTMPGHLGSQWLFPGRDSHNRPLKNIQAAWQRIRAGLGLDMYRIHDLRHSFASFLAASGHSLYEVQKMLGHADPRTSMRYAHLHQEQLVRAAESVSQLIGGGDVENASGRDAVMAESFDKSACQEARATSHRPENMYPDRSPHTMSRFQERSLGEGLVREMMETAIKAAFEQVFRQLNSH